MLISVLEIKRLGKTSINNIRISGERVRSARRNYRQSDAMSVWTPPVMELQVRVRNFETIRGHGAKRKAIAPGRGPNEIVFQEMLMIDTVRKMLVSKRLGKLVDPHISTKVSMAFNPMKLDIEQLPGFAKCTSEQKNEVYIGGGFAFSVCQLDCVAAI